MDAKKVLIKEEYDIVIARSLVKSMAKELGFGIVAQTKIATAVSELARNITTHAKEGAIEIREVHGEDGGKEGLEIIASDHGPGIANIAQAMKDGYTSGGGLGLGLGGTKRLMDEFEIKSVVDSGTMVRVRKWM
ncbi:MAG: anti-sigma regulatory factor [Chloroflexota bacterium]|nr:anti-sigma regulatory factor [Chloroflexota bacterium]